MSGSSHSTQSHISYSYPQRGSPMSGSSQSTESHSCRAESRAPLLRVLYAATFLSLGGRSAWIHPTRQGGVKEHASIHIHWNNYGLCKQQIWHRPWSYFISGMCSQPWGFGLLTIVHKLAIGPSAWELWLGTFRLGTFAWKHSLGNQCLGTAWDLSLGIVLLEPVA